MAENRLLVNHEQDSIQLSWQTGQAAPRFAPAVPFEHPFDTQALAELRWYLEDYLRYPYGIEPQRAANTEKKFQVWGQQLFDLVFSRTEEAREFFQEATREGLNQCEIAIASDNPAVLNLPWELLYSPKHQFLAPLLAGIYRRVGIAHPTQQAEIGEMSQDKLNILLVIARPYGEQDVAFKTIARPMLEALKPIRRLVNLKVLRPPSFQEFEQELNANKGFYHIVHFDGHGTVNAKGQGELVFEFFEHPHPIKANRIAQKLADCRVPVFVLNACKSAQEGGEKFSSVVVLPHLKTQSPTELMEALRLGLDTFQGTDEEGTDKSLYVSLDYSFAKLSDHARQHLPFLALFSKQVNANLLNYFSSGERDDSFKETYQAIFGESLQTQEWLRILNEAVEAGILEHLGETYYKIHPALPWYLRQRLAEGYSKTTIGELGKKLLGFYFILVAFILDPNTITKVHQVAKIFFISEEENLLQNLRLAEHLQEWVAARAILQTLGQIYEMLDRRLEFRLLRKSALHQVGTDD